MARSSKIRELEHQIKEVQAERDAFERDVKVYLSENQALKKQVEVLRSSQLATDSQAQNLLVDIKQKHKQLSDLREQEHAAELTLKETKLKEVIQSNQELEKQLRKYDASMRQQKSLSDQVKVTMTELKLENEKLKSSEKLNKNSLLSKEEEISSLEEEVLWLTEKNKDKDNQIATMKLKYEQETELSASKARVRIRVLENQLDALKADVDKKNKESAKLQNKLVDCANQKEAAAVKQNQVLRLEKELDQAKRFKDTLKENLSQANNEIQNLKSQSEESVLKQRLHVQTLEAKLEKLQKENQDKTAQLRKVSTKLSDIENESHTSSLKLNLHSRALETKISRLEEEIKKKDDKLREISDELQNLKAQSEAHLKEKIHSQVLEEKLDKMKRENQEKTAQLCKVNNENQNLKSQSEESVLKQRLHVQTLEAKLEKMQKENQDKAAQLRKVSTKLSDIENESHTSSLKLNLHSRALETKISRLEEEIKKKDDKLREVSDELQNLKAQSEAHLKEKIHSQVLEEKLDKLKRENQEKTAQLCKVSSKLSDMENDSQTLNLKLNLKSRALETKVTKLEAELKKKDEKICEVTTKLHAHEVEVISTSSQQQTQLKSLQEKVRKLEAENRSKEEQLCKVSSKLAHVELDSDSVASSYRVKIKALEEKLEGLTTENHQKEELLIKSESSLSQAENRVIKLRDQIRRLEMENSRKGDELNELRSLESELSSKTSENISQIQNAKRVKNRLESANSQLKAELGEATRKISSLECDVADVKCTLKQKERQIEKLKNAERQLQSDVSDKTSEEQDLRQKLESLQGCCDKLKSDLQSANCQKRSLEAKNIELNSNLSKEQTQKQKLQKSSTTSEHKLHSMKKELENQLEQQSTRTGDLEKQLERVSGELQLSQKREEKLQEKCMLFENDESSRVGILEVQLTDVTKKCSELQAISSAQSMKHENLLRENREMKKQLREMDAGQSAQTRKVGDMEKTNYMLKESCVMLEKQVVDLESFNNELIKKQETLMIERDNALKKSSSMEVELRSMQHQLKNEIFELDQCSTGQITDLKIQLRNEINRAHEMTEKHRDLERRYNLLELNATGVQRKLNAEKESHERAASELTRVKSDMPVMQQSLMSLDHQLRAEIDRCDALEREKTQLLNRMETDKLEQSHELVRLNCTGAQQAKLIDFLQSRVEELEPLDKKKKKKKPTIYQAPLQYTELRDLLEQEKVSNVKLQEQVNMLRSELQTSNSKMKRMKHGMDTPLSPGTVAAITSLAKSPAPTTALSPTSKSGKLKSKPRMHHNIPHRLSTWLCTRATRCSVCLNVVRFGHSVLRCTECHVVCHAKCQKSVTNTCGLPGGLFEQFREGAATSNLSPITCVFKGSSSDRLHGCLKVLCGDDSWTPRNVRLTDRQLRISPPNVKSPSSKSNKDDVIDLTQAAYIHTEINQLELPSTAKQDLPYAFKLQTGSSNSCWPSRSIYFLPASFTEKHQWVEKLELVVAQYSQTKNMTANAKIFGNEILTLLSDEKLEMNCSLPISKKLILFGCDEGLFLLAPSISSVSSRSNMTQIKGVANIFQMLLLSKSKVVAIEGPKHRLISFDSSEVESHKVTLQEIGKEGCHVVSTGQAEGVYYLCVASASTVSILKYNDRLKKFCPQKEIATSEPCTCMLFTACSIIIGTNAFYEIDLTAYTVDEFVDIDDTALSRNLTGENAFPVSVLKITDEDGRQEFLLCYHEFGIFVDGFGRPTRPGQVTWSRMPLSFEYREPYLVIVQFNSVEIIQFDVKRDTSAQQTALDHAFLGFPSARYLGPAITEGAVYLCSTDGSRTSVFCCKGNMKGKRVAEMNANKRRYAALSSSTDSLASPTPKRSMALSDKSNLLTKRTQFFSASCESGLDTSQWTTAPSEYDEASLSTATESETLVPSFESSVSSDATLTDDSSSKLQWRPVKSTNPPTKPARKARNRLATGHNHIPSSEV